MSRISIHALLAESDMAVTEAHTRASVISIHALLAESDAQRGYILLQFRYFYPRSPCGERPENSVCCPRCIVISIHALLAESDMVILRKTNTPSQFLSTLSLRRATYECWTALNRRLRFLSTLSLRRATTLRQLQFALCRNFYPRSPCGERLACIGFH